jgi:hypothetical protein
MEPTDKPIQTWMAGSLRSQVHTSPRGHTERYSELPPLEYRCSEKMERIAADTMDMRVKRFQLE